LVGLGAVVVGDRRPGLVKAVGVAVVEAGVVTAVAEPNPRLTPPLVCRLKLGIA
jgi:hypothetical protein